MSKLKIKQIQKSEVLNSLTIQETSLIMGGDRSVIIDSSFNDIVISGAGDDVIITDPLQFNVNGRELLA